MKDSVIGYMLGGFVNSEFHNISWAEYIEEQLRKETGQFNLEPDFEEYIWPEHYSVFLDLITEKRYVDAQKQLRKIAFSLGQDYTLLNQEVLGASFL